MIKSTVNSQQSTGDSQRSTTQPTCPLLTVICQLFPKKPPNNYPNPPKNPTFAARLPGLILTRRELIKFLNKKSGKCRITN